MMLDGTQLQYDPLRSPLLQRELPGLLTAFDGEAMRERLQQALFGEARPNFVVERCTPGQAIYDGNQCVLRYKLTVRDTATGDSLSPLVIARLFPDPGACEVYFHTRLEPLARQIQGREEVAAFASPVASIPPLNMAVYVFPIDGELPALVGATDRQRILDIFRSIAPQVLGQGATIEDCRVELGHYGRQHRCVLRYHVGSTQQQAPAVVYGKVAADGRGALAGPVIDALREQVLDGDSPYRFNIPRSFGFWPDLQLALLEGIRGVPQVAQLVKARLQGDPPLPGAPSLEETIEACARIAATLHASDISLGSPRTLDDELSMLSEGFATVERISPDLGAQFHSWLDKVRVSGARSDPMHLRFSHGDFTYTQLIFDGAESGLVDFDTVCQAEPALDLGQFLAYARVAALKGKHKAEKSAAGASSEEMTKQLCDQFLSTYVEAVGDKLDDIESLDARVPVYEAISLLRMALHSWQKLKGTRLEYVITVLEERIPCLP